MPRAVPSVERAAQWAKVNAVVEFLKRSATMLLIGGKWVAAKSGKDLRDYQPGQ